MNIDIERYTDLIWANILVYAPKVLLALLTLWIGLRIVGWIIKLLNKQLEAKEIDNTLRPFLLNLLSWTLKIMLFISVASMVGIQTTSFVAILGAAGLAIGLALQGSLSNFAGSALIMIFKPYKVGDFIEAQGEKGSVIEIQIFSTILASPDNRKIIIPNGALSNGNITNYSAMDKVRLNLTMGIAYEDDIDRAKSILLDILTRNAKVLPDPAPFVGVLELADSSVNLAMRGYTTPDDYWDVYFNVMETSKKELDANNISIPYPQMDVHSVK
ncbi:mechanosensitive ion channel [Fulvivirgaceae bacterium BMA10]|uniref:Mechanosensitive ion channel n=1 Tax=Splendidivirga corallicola TaxID=3051826 RepID=A0ABT8KRV6_9BACT|nr:mechanosensitive ion channel [Fulvivirgaceae bacterium BMA10]